ncbi:MAG TPA: acireductone dioxygenase [Pseudomonas sp.]|nr:acireductone dioxygenase [Pseudomonas sp.]
MSILSVYHQSSPDTPNKVLTHADDIAATLAEQGVRFEQLTPAERIRPGTEPAQVIAALGAQVEALGAGVVEVLSVHPEHGQKDEIRAGLIDERRHAGADLRFFVSGRGLLSLRIGEYVYALMGERGDVVSVPAGTAQWFDIGEQPNLVLVRVFESEEGRKVELTGNELSRAFPTLEDTFLV